MIYIVDRSSVANVHVPYNTGMLHVFRTIFKSTDITFIAELEHMALVKKSLGQDTSQFQFENTTIVKSTSIGIKKAVEWVQKILADRRFLKRLFKNASSEDLIFFCSFPPISFPIFRRILKKFPHVNVILTLHGELELMYEHKSVQEKMIGKFFLNLFAAHLPNLKFLVLNNISKKTLVKRGASSESQIIAITHPYAYSCKEIVHSLNSVLQFAHVGSLGQRKNGKLLFKLAEILQDRIENGTIVVKNVGALEADLRAEQNNLVECLSENGNYISREEFDSALSKIDYALFFYDHSQFVFRASGTLFDIIEWGKPIIALRHPLFEDIFAETEIGFLCDSVEEMAELIVSLSNENDRDLITQKYKFHQHQISLLKSKYSIDNIASDLKTQLIAKDLTLA